MKINPDLKRIFREHNINYDEGILYLLSLYFGIVIPESKFEQTIKQINFIKVVERNYKSDSNDLIWNVPLFESQNLLWDWVIEYREMFRRIRKDRGGTLDSCLVRMKKFFAENPEVRKEDVIEATKMYLRTVTDPAYLTGADYFITKDKGIDAKSKLMLYLEILYEKRKESKNSTKMM